MNIEKWKEVFSDETFVKSLLGVETAAEVQEILQEKEIHMTEEEILSLRDFFIKVEDGEISGEQLERWAAQIENGELTEEILEEVSGGSVGVIIMGVLCIAACAVGLVVAVDNIVTAITDRHW